MAIAERPLTQSPETHSLSQEYTTEEEQRWLTFLAYNHKLEICESLTPQTPYVSFCLETYDSKRLGLKTGGGLGILKADKTLEAERLGSPSWDVSIFYSLRWKQVLDQNFRQFEEESRVHPRDFGYEKLPFHLVIHTNNHHTPIEFYHKGKTLVLFEPNIGLPYQGGNSCEHRLYQQVVLGFGGMQGILKLGLDPGVIQLDESASSFAAICYLDKLCKEGKSLEEARRILASKTNYVNHSLVPAVSSAFTEEDFEKYVFKNIETPEITNMLRDMIRVKGGRMPLETIALELSGYRSGVSNLVASLATEKFKLLDGTSIDFIANTNGISFDRWVHPELLELYRRKGIVNEFNMAGECYLKKLDLLTAEELVPIWTKAQKELSEYLLTREDQYGHQITTNPNKVKLGWLRRYVGYKRPGLVFRNPDLLASILEKNDSYFIFGGRVHPDDEAMKIHLQKILKICEAHPILRRRVYYVLDYDDVLATYLLRGLNGWSNTPIVGEEACGTSVDMAIANMLPVISTVDGGMADIPHPPILRIVGNNEEEETASLYWNFEKAIIIGRDPRARVEQGVKQLKAFLPTIAGGRMMAEYYFMLFPRSLPKAA